MLLEARWGVVLVVQLVVVWRVACMMVRVLRAMGMVLCALGAVIVMIVMGVSTGAALRAQARLRVWSVVVNSNRVLVVRRRPR